MGWSYRFTHELVRRALYDRLSGLRRAELHLRVGEALEAAEGRSGRTLADLAHHFSAAAPFGGTGRAAEYNLLAASCGFGGARLRRGGRAAANRAGAGDRQLRLSGQRSTSSSVMRATGPARRSRRSKRSGRPRTSPGSWRTPSCSLARRSATRTRAGGRGWTIRARSSCSRRRRPRSATAAPSCGSGCWAGSRVRSTSRAITSVERSSARARSRWPGGCTTAPASPQCWCVPTGPAERPRSRRSSNMLTEARSLGEELGNTEIRAEAMAWRVPAFVALGDLESARQEVAELRETAEQTAQPFMLHVAEHYGSAIALCDGHLDRGRGAGRALARLEPASDRPGCFGRLRDPDVQHPPRAGPSGGARPGGQDPGERGPTRRAVAAWARRAARRARDGSGGET